MWRELHAGNTLEGKARRKKKETSFLKKRSKKLLLIACRADRHTVQSGLDKHHPPKRHQHTRNDDDCKQAREARVHHRGSQNKDNGADIKRHFLVSYGLLNKG
jgi:hypothetical protein